MPDEDESDAMSNEAYDQEAELIAMNAPGAADRIEERQKAVAERLTPKSAVAPADVPYVTWIPSEERAGLGMRMAVRMEEYRAAMDGLANNYMRVRYDTAAYQSATAAYGKADKAALVAYFEAVSAVPFPPPVPWWGSLLPWRSPPGITPVQRMALETSYEALKAARSEMRITYGKALDAAINGRTNAGEPDIESIDPQTYFYKLMTSHKGKRADQLVEIGKMGRTEKPQPKRRGFFGFGSPR